MQQPTANDNPREPLVLIFVESFLDVRRAPVEGRSKTAIGDAKLVSNLSAASKTLNSNNIE
jgi:hypothetical protein